MLGIHSIYKLPQKSNQTVQNYNDLYCFELVCLILSSLYWRKNNGNIKLVCNDPVYDWVKQYNLQWVWDYIDTDTLKKLPPDIDYSVFWTFPKMFIHFNQKDKFTSIDADLFFTGTLKNYNEDIIYAHEEVDTLGTTYPFFNQNPEYSEIFNFNLHYNAVNTSLITFNKLEILKELEEITYKFIKNTHLSQVNSPYTYTIYCEQKVLGNLIHKNKYTYRSLMTEYWDCNDLDQSGVNSKFLLADANIYHLWGNKSVLYEKQAHRKFYLDYFLSFIQRDFPEYESKVLDLLPKFKL